MRILCLHNLSRTFDFRLLCIVRLSGFTALGTFGSKLFCQILFFFLFTQSLKPFCFKSYLTRLQKYHKHYRDYKHYIADKLYHLDLRIAYRHRVGTLDKFQRASYQSVPAYVEYHYRTPFYRFFRYEEYYQRNRKTYRVEYSFIEEGRIMPRARTFDIYRQRKVFHPLLRNLYAVELLIKEIAPSADYLTE